MNLLQRVKRLENGEADTCTDEYPTSFTFVPAGLSEEEWRANKARLKRREEEERERLGQPDGIIFVPYDGA